MGQLYDQLSAAYDSIKKDLPPQIRLGVVLGSAQGGCVKFDNEPVAIPYSAIKGFPPQKSYQASGHAKRYLIGSIGDVNVVVMDGRYHSHEGYTGSELVTPIRFMKLMGVDTFLLTNAGGGLRPSFRVGDLMFITDHLTLFLPPNANPLMPHEIEFGEQHIPQVPGVLYDRSVINSMRRVADRTGIRHKEGGYAFLTGPQFESGIDTKILMVLMMLTSLGAVGMSTVPEAMAAYQMGIRVGGITGITNKLGWGRNSTTDAEVKAQAGAIGPKVNTLVHGLVEELYK